MTNKDVVEALGWSAARLTRLERTDTTDMDEGDLEALAVLLRFPARFFTSPPGSRVRQEDLLFRAPKATSAKEKEYLAQFANAAGDFIDVLDQHHRMPPSMLELAQPGTDVRAAAAAVRDVFGVERGAPIRHLAHAMEHAGVVVVKRARRSKSTGKLDWRAYPKAGDEPAPSQAPAAEPVLLERHHGYSARTGVYRDRPLAVVRATDSWERTRWTLAHEVGHLVLHRHGGQITEDKEVEASMFASELLAPAKAVAKELLATPTLYSLMPVKMKWGISLGALVTHLFHSGLIDEDRRNSLRAQLYTRINPETGHTWGMTEPGWNEHKPERPRLLRRWVELCFGEDEPTKQAAQELIWPQDMLEDLLADQRPAPRPNAGPKPPAQDFSSGTVADLDRFRARAIRQA